jgi:hypothetical protein
MKFDSFGRPILCMPRLRFLDGEENGGGGDQQQTGFPADTPVAEMTQEQQLAYWQHQSRKHERRASSRADYDDLKAKAAELEQLKAANQTEAEKALAEAREEARREGEVLGAGRYLTDAVKAKFQHLTGMDDDETTEAFGDLGIDPAQFVKDDGDIDVDRITKLAARVAPATGGTTQTSSSDPIREAMERQQQKPGATSGGSLREMTRLRVDELQGKK